MFEGKIEHGQAAQRILNDQAFIEALEFSRAQIHAAWETESDAVERDALWAELQGMDRFYSRLEEALETGRQELERRNERSR